MKKMELDEKTKKTLDRIAAWITPEIIEKFGIDKAIEGAFKADYNFALELYEGKTDRSKKARSILARDAFHLFKIQEAL